MPTIRKVSPQEAKLYWEEAPEYAPQPLDTATREHLLCALPDRRGISRIDHKATHSWLARVYPPGMRQGMAKSFSDGVYGGPEEALRAAVAWRDAQQIEKKRRAKGPRIQRVQRQRQVGYMAWNQRLERRYFAAGQARGWEEARLAALEWAGLTE